MKELVRDERGVYMIVEAAIVYPIMLVMIMVIIFFCAFMVIKANMQSALETALVYYRTELSDRYVSFLEDERISGNDVSDTKYTKLESTSGWTNIYEEFFSEMSSGINENRFKQIFLNNYKFLNFASVLDENESSGIYDGGLTVHIESTANFVIYRELTASAEQKVKMPFVNGMFGIDNTLTIRADASIVVSDSVSLMRATDIVDYFWVKTGLEDKWESSKFNNAITDFIKFIKGE